MITGSRSLRRRRSLLLIRNGSRASRHNWHIGLGHQVSRGELVAHLLDVLDRGADKNNAGLLESLGKVGVLSLRKP